MRKVIAAERGDIPTEFQIEDLLPRLAIELPPGRRAKMSERRQMDVEAGKKVLGLLQDPVHGGTVHGTSGRGDE
ncbi:hypothetical protein D1872_342650 [compost metagenome]